MQRVLEPEYMDTVEEASDYDAMDHSGPNAAFIERLLALGARGRVLDIGTGPAHIPIALLSALAERGDRDTTVVAIDAAQTMLDVAARRVREAGLEARISLARADAKGLPYPDGSFDVVCSNTILHHIPDPRPFLREAARVLKKGGVLLVRDLFRPETPERRDELVELYAQGATPAQKELFRASLQAALTVDELTALVRELGVPGVEVVVDTDRHMSLQTVRRRLSLAQSGPRDARDEARDEEPGRRVPLTAVSRPTRWARRSGPAEAEARRLERVLTRVERLIMSGAPRVEIRKQLAEIPRGPFYDPSFHVRAGDAFFDGEKLPEAELHYRAALLTAPDSSDALYGLGQVYAETDRLSDMVEVWLQVRKLDLASPHMPWAVTEDEFAEIAETTVERLPPEVRAKLGNLPLVMGDVPSEDMVRDGVDPRVLGLISGIPLSEKLAVGEGTPMLDCVHLFQRNIERVTVSAEMLREEIAKTVVHEVLHYFGLDEDEVARWGLE